MPFIEVNGAALRYDLTGAGPTTLVLVHEMGGTLDSWDWVLPVLSRGRRVLRYDTRGAGLSEKIRGAADIDVLADDSAALLDALDIRAKVAIAGVAVGGAIALHFAARHAARTAALISDIRFCSALKITGIDFPRELGDGIDRFSDDHFALAGTPRFGQPVQAVGEDVVVLLLYLFAFLGTALINTAFEPDVGAGQRHHGDEKQLRMIQLCDFLAVEQRSLARLGAVVSQQNTLVHGAPHDRGVSERSRTRNEHNPCARASQQAAIPRARRMATRSASSSKQGCDAPGFVEDLVGRHGVLE